MIAVECYIIINKLNFVTQFRFSFSDKSEVSVNLLSLHGCTETETTVTKTTSNYCFLKVFLNEKIDDSAKGGLTRFWEIFTMIPCAPKYLKRK